MFDILLDAESDVESIPTISFPLRGRYGVENDLLNDYYVILINIT